MKYVYLLLIATQITFANNIQQSMVIDSSGNQYTMALQNHECIAYNPFVVAIGIVNRNFNPTWILNYHSTPGDLSFWVHDYSIYNPDSGAALYPSTFAGTIGPYVSFPTILPPYWAALYCNGWFSGLWIDSVDLGPGNNQIQLVIGKELPTGDICFIICETSPYKLVYGTYSADLSTQIAGGSLTPPADTRYYVGWDCNLTAGIAYVVYTDPALNMYYQTTTDGVTWSGETSYNLIWPNPYTNNQLYLNNGMQAVVTDAGDPLIVFAIMNGDNLEYPQDGKIYVSLTAGQPCVEVSNPSDAKNFYPTISTAGNYAAVTYLTPRNSMQDSMAWHDIHINWSTDNGVTWGIPENITSWSTRRISFPQLAKRLDVTRDRAYLIYVTCRLPEQDMDLMWAYDYGYSVSIYVNFLRAPRIGIEETALRPSPHALRLLDVFPNPAADHAYISFALPVSGNVSLKLFSAAGRFVKTIEQCHKAAGVYTADLKTNELASGTYFLILETQENKMSRSIVVVH